MGKNYAFKRMMEDLKKGDFPSVLLFFGEERLQVDWAVRQIIEKYVNPETYLLDVTIFQGLPPLDELVSVCETLTMFSEKRIVIIENSGLFKMKRKDGEEEESEDVPDSGERKALGEYLPHIPSSTILLFREQDVDKRLQFTKMIQKVGDTYQFERLDAADLKVFIRNRFVKAGKALREDVAETIVELSGYLHPQSTYTLYHLENDLAKILSHAEGAEVTDLDVHQTMAGDLNTYVFSFVDALASDKKGEAYELLSNMLRSGESFYKILGLLISQYELLLDIRQLQDENRSLVEMEKELKVHPFRLRKGASVAGRYTSSQLYQFVKRLYEIDRQNKSGLLNPQLALELFIGEL